MRRDAILFCEAPECKRFRWCKITGGINKWMSLGYLVRTQAKAKAESGIFMSMASKTLSSSSNSWFT